MIAALCVVWFCAGVVAGFWFALTWIERRTWQQRAVGWLSLLLLLLWLLFLLWLASGEPTHVPS
jgi:uncharacterized membrane protein